jgi:CHAT domain-containing protein
MMLALSPALMLAALTLMPGTPAPATVSGGEVRAFRVAARPDHVVTGFLEQHDADLVVRVRSPNGALVAEIDGRRRAQEVIAFTTATEGVYTIEVAALRRSAKRTTFTIQIEDVRPATADMRLLDAVVLTTDAKKLVAGGGRAALEGAVDRLTRAHELWRALAMAAPELAALVSVADAQYGLSQYAAAQALYRDALAICEARDDRQTCAEVRTNLAMACWRLSQTPEALTLLDRAAGDWHQLGSAYGEAGALSNRGLLLQEVGLYDEARQHLQRALTLIRSVKDLRGEGFVHNNIGAALDQLGHSREGLQSLTRAVALFQQVGDRLAQARAMLFQAHIHYRLGSRSRALATAQRALSIIRTVSNRSAEADALALVGRIVAASDPAASKSAYDRAGEIYRSVGSRRGQADVLHAQGVAALAAKQAPAAVAYLLDALTIRHAISLPRLEADTLARLSEAERAIGNLDAARSAIESAIALIEQSRTEIFDRDLRAAYLRSYEDYYGQHIDLLVDLHRRGPGQSLAAQVFAASERQRARQLADAVRTRWAANASDILPEVRERERELRRQLNYWSWQAWQQAALPESRPREQQIRSTVERLLSDYAEVEAGIARAIPGIRSLLQPDPLPLDALQRDALDARTLVLQYVLGTSRSYLLAITRDGIEIHDLPARRAIEAHARALTRELGVRSGGAPQLAARRDAAIALGRILLGPVAGALNGRRLLIIPDGALHYVAFAALGHPVSRLPVVESDEIVVAPSVSLLLSMKRRAARRVRAPKRLAVLADPVFDRDVRLTATSPATGSPGGRRFSRLPFSRDEADRILQLVPEGSRLRAVDFDANRPLVTGGGLKGYQIVHIASHGVQDDLHPDLSGIVLSLVDASGAARDGFLRLQDLPTVPVDADLVVLSACATDVASAATAKSGGEGLANLARGWFSAGVPAVISTLWQIDDESTAELMTRFYRAVLIDGETVASALRTAQRSIARERRWRDPYYWAGFVLQGVS